MIRDGLAGLGPWWIAEGWRPRYVPFCWEHHRPEPCVPCQVDVVRSTGIMLRDWPDRPRRRPF